MKKVLILIGICTCSLVSASTYYVSTNGNNNNPGSFSQPWRTWEKALSTAIAGDTVFFRGGVYPHTVTSGLGMWVYNSGTRANPICFFNYPGEVPILDGKDNTSSSGLNYGIRVTGVSFIHFKGLTIRNFYENYSDVLCAGFNCEGDINNITIENCVTHDINGIGIGVYDYDTIYIKNCDAYNVCDSLSWWPGQNGVAFQCNNYAHLYGSHVYESAIYYEGCRAWNFSDNGFAGGGTGYVEYKNCWAFNGGMLYGEGCGFKLRASVREGETVIPIQRKLLNCITAVNGYYGYSDNNRGYTAQNSQYINCVAYRNGFKDLLSDVTGGYGWCNFNYAGIEPQPNWITLNCISYANESHNLDPETPENYYPGGVEDTFLERYNSWNNPPNIAISDNDFLSLNWQEMLRSRKSDNSLPDIDFLRLKAGSNLIDAGLDTLGLSYKGSAPDIGYSEYESGSIIPVNPVYVSSVIENATPSRLEMTYDITLANVIPATSAFAVRVNSSTRSVTAVAISGAKVLLTLTSPVVYGDVVTVAYTKPASNPLQTATGGQAASISPQNVTNNVAAIIPVYVSSVIENATPSRLEMTYNITLANVIPATSAFAVRVNSSTRSVTAVAISGAKVLLTLAGPVVYGDVVTIAYTKPASNPLQTATGGQAASISSQNVTNNVAAINPVYVSSAIENATPSRLEMTYDITMANVIPATSAFAVRVNSSTRSVTAVAISGVKVLLTLAGPVVSGDVVTVAYTKPASNPLQTVTGGQAASLTAQNVTNYVTPVIPVYVNSVIEDATPSTLEINYDIPLADIVPSITAFTVKVNSTIRSISSISISENKVLLILITPGLYDDVVTVSYTVPAINPIQTSAGGKATSFTARTVSNNCRLRDNLPPVASLLSPEKSSSFVAPATIVFDISAYDPDGSISKVEVFNGSAKLAELTTTPYSYTWKDVPAGTYSVTVVATDNLYSRTTSEALTVIVTNNTTSINQIPKISILSPITSASLLVPSTITITADATDIDGVINKVEFFIGDIKIGECLTPPYTLSYKLTKAGTYEIKAVTTDNMNATGISPAVIIHANLSNLTDVINLYPNPNDGRFKTSMESAPLEEEYVIDVLTLHGKTVYKDILFRDEITKEYDLSFLNSGVYIIMISTNKIVYTKKFIKM